LEGNNKLIVLL